MRSLAFLLFLLLAAFASGCDDPPLSCGVFVYDDVRMRCACPEGTTERDDGSCLLPDGGVITPPGLPDSGTGADAGSDGGEGDTDACRLTTFYRDFDDDGFGDPATTQGACTPPDGFVANDDDCNDDCAACQPGGTEVCDELDNDCDESTDEGTATTYYRDADMDGFGDPTMPMLACTPPAGFGENAEDCDDDCSACRPGGVEVCDAEMRDENCEMGPNEGCACTIGMTRPCPGGSDTGECRAGMQTCLAGAWSACIDAIAPTTETCNGRDDDCNTIPDDGAAAASCGTAPRATGIGCSAGACFVSSCATGWRDCDTSFGNGCEAQLGSVSTCTTCGDACGFRCGGGGCLDAIAVTAGDSHGCALLSDRTVTCWGDDSAGQLGNDTAFSSRTTPVPVFGLADVIAVEAGGRHTCAVRMDGTVLCWGSDTSGQLGNGSTSGNQPVPGLVPGLSNVRSIAAGGSHTCALRNDGSVSCWGSDSSGELGNGSSTTGNQQSPVAASVFGASAITAGQSHTCVIATGSVLRCWGSDSSGQLGNDAPLVGQALPVTVGSATGLTSVVAISAGGFFTCALTASGRVFCWGADSNGQLGNDTATPTPIRTPVEVTSSTGLSGATRIGAGGAHVCALGVDGSVWCWGSDSHGQIGDGPPTSAVQSLPARAAMPAGFGAASVLEAGGSHTCVVAAGELWCWGRNSAGQLGDGSMTQRESPHRIVAP